VEFDFVGADHLIRIPKTDQLLQPVLAVVPLQVIAYEMAVARGNVVISQKLGKISNS
jgi:glutamine---fructose-6-phosphate transaminase (isomerizing)